MPELCHLSLQSAGCPNFCLSLLHRFWLSELFFWFFFSFSFFFEIVTAWLNDYSEPSLAFERHLRHFFGVCEGKLVIATFIGRCLEWFSCIWMHSQINWELPIPGLKIVGFFVQKETPTSRLKGVDKGLTSLFLQCLDVETMLVHHQQSLIWKHTIQPLGYFIFVILPPIFA